MRLRELLEENESTEMSEGQIKEAMAESGKMSIPQLMSYMKSKYAGKYDLKLAKMCAREIKNSM